MGQQVGPSYLICVARRFDKLSGPESCGLTSSKDIQTHKSACPNLYTLSFHTISEKENTQEDLTFLTLLHM